MYNHEQLMKARHDGWLRAAARGRLAAQTRRARAERAERAGHAVAAPGRRLSLIGVGNEPKEIEDTDKRNRDSVPLLLLPAVRNVHPAVPERTQVRRVL